MLVAVKVERGDVASVMNKLQLKIDDVKAMSWGILVYEREESDSMQKKKA